MNKRILLSALLIFISPALIFAKKDKKMSENASKMVLVINQLAHALKDSGLSFSDISDTEIDEQLSKLPEDFLTKIRGKRSVEEFNALFKDTAHRVSAMLDATIAKKGTKPEAIKRSWKGFVHGFEKVICSISDWVVHHKVLFVVIVALVIINLQQ